MSCWGWKLGLSGMRDRFGIFGTIIKIRKLSLLLVMMLRIPNKHFWRRCRGRLITNQEWIKDFELSFASLIWLSLSILSYSFTPIFFYFYLMQGNVWIEDIFRKFCWQSWSLIQKKKSQAQEEIINTSARSFNQSRRSPELVFRVRSHGEQINPRVLSSHYGQHPHWTCYRDQWQLWAQAWTYQHGAIQPVLWEGTRRC